MTKWGELQFCDPCYWDMTGRVPVKLSEEMRETTDCAGCGERTRSGIYVRVNLDEYAQS